MFSSEVSHSSLGFHFAFTRIRYGARLGRGFGGWEHDYPTADRNFSSILDYVTNMRVHLDEDLLRQIAAITGGQYFRATNARALEEIYRQIDELEKTPVNVRRYIEFSEHFRPFVFLAVLFVVGEWVFRVRRHPLYV